jgi:hypothetical protein
MHSHRQLLSVFIVLGSILCCAGAPAAVHTVTSSGELATAISAAADGDIIEMVAGNYDYVNGRVITTGLTLRSQSGDPADVAISLTYLTQGILAVDSFVGTQPVRLEGITFQYLELQGGTIFMEHEGHLVIDRCVFQSSMAYVLLDVSGTTEILETQFLGLHSTAILANSGHLTMSGCLWQGNETPNLITIDQGSLDMSMCSLVENHGTPLLLADVEASISHTLFQDNIMGAAAVRMALFGNLVMDNCTLVGNTLGYGALNVGPLSVAHLTQCTILDNTIRDGTLWPAAELTLICCDVDQSRWDIQGGTWTLDNSDCVVANIQETLGGMKAMFHR